MRILAALFFLLFLSLSLNGQGRPNIIVVLVDDMGYSDLGCYGGEIKTPHLDQLARNGIRYTQAYNTSKCWTSRISLLTGQYHHRSDRETRRRRASPLPLALETRSFGAPPGAHPSIPAAVASD